MIPSRVESLCCVAVVEDRGTPLVTYTLRQAERLIRDLTVERDEAKRQRDSPGFRFLQQWILELKSSVRVAKKKHNPCCP